MRKLMLQAEPLAFLLFVAGGGIAGYKLLLAQGFADGAAGAIAGASTGLIAIAWVLLRRRSASLG